jgi:hypothetical protein
MNTLLVNVAEDDNHQFQIPAAPSIDKHGRLIINGDGAQIVYNTWRFFVLNAVKTENEVKEETTD